MANYTWQTGKIDESRLDLSNGGETMTEQPLFSVEAQVFQLDPKQEKRLWLEMSSQPVYVHFYQDSVRKTYRLLCVVGSKPLINCSLTHSIVITRTSAKFAQWLDQRLKVVYGFGFNNEQDMEMFINKFKELQALIPSGNQQPDLSISTSYCGDSMDATGLDVPGPLITSQIETERLDSADLTMRMELEHLKRALADSSQTAKIWEEELQKIRDQNHELKTNLEAIMAMNNGTRSLQLQADIGATSAQGHGDQMQRVGDFGRGLLVSPHPASGDYKRISVEDLMGNNMANALVTDQLQAMLDNSKACQRRLDTCESNHGPDSESRQLVLEVQKAIGEKLQEALTLHKVLTRLL